VKRLAYLAALICAVFLTTGESAAAQVSAAAARTEQQVLDMKEVAMQLTLVSSGPSFKTLNLFSAAAIVATRMVDWNQTTIKGERYHEDQVLHRRRCSRHCERNSCRGSRPW
jgi:hypothetical protein